MTFHPLKATTPQNKNKKKSHVTFKLIVVVTKNGHEDRHSRIRIFRPVLGQNDDQARPHSHSHVTLRLLRSLRRSRRLFLRRCGILPRSGKRRRIDLHLNSVLVGGSRVDADTAVPETTIHSVRRRVVGQGISQGASSQSE